MRALALVALVACKGGSAPPATTGSSGSAPPATPAVGSSSPVGATIAAATTLDGGARPERCADPCRYLTDTALADVSARVQRECGTPWPFDQADCDAPLYQINCIYAAHGYVFKRPEWRAKFEHAPWYHPRADFNERELSAMETASIHELKQKDKSCHAPAEPVSAADRELVQKALSDLEAKDDVDARLRNMNINDKSKLHYASKDGSKRTITVENLYHYAGGGEYVDMSIDLIFDGDKLVDVQL